MFAPAQTCAPWATIADLCAPCNDYEMDPVALEDALSMASDVLFNFTGRRWPGVCSEVVRPCDGDTCGCGGDSWRARTCGCGGLSEVRLPGRPVVSVIEVKVDGVIVNPATYEVQDGYKLVALGDPPTPWPSCQVLYRPDTELRTFSVEYEWGTEPPAGGRKAAASLACQLALACDPDAIKDGRCRLPRRVTSITRQGVTLAILDPLTLFADGLTGLSDVDLWVQSIILGDRRRRATVVDPAHHPSVRRTP